ncbi:MAG: hypothetical protein ABLQ96_01985 [Candidatus Acidiferrum sp.]
MKNEIQASVNFFLGDSSAAGGAVTPGTAMKGTEVGLEHAANNRPLQIAVRRALREEGHKVSANALAKGARFGAKAAFVFHVGFAANDGREAYQGCMAN